MVPIDSVVLTNTTSITQFAQAYIQSAPSLIMGGDIGAIVIGLISFYVAIVVINKLSTVLLKFMKYLIIMAIVGLGYYSLVMEFITRMAGADPIMMIIGLIGLATGFVAVLFALFTLFMQTKKTARQIRGVHAPIPTPAPSAVQPAVPQYEKKEVAAPEKELPVSEIERRKAQLKELMKEKHNLITIVTYILIAEFGVFSSKTISAPTPEVGMALLAVFFVGVIVFVVRTYADPKMGLMYVGAAFAFGIMLSLFLGHFWAAYPLETMFGMGYFETDALVATISGVALSLFMGAKTGGG